MTVAAAALASCATRSDGSVVERASPPPPSALAPAAAPSAAGEPGAQSQAPGAPSQTPGPWSQAPVVVSNAGAWRIAYRLGMEPLVRGETFGVEAWVFAADAADMPRTDVALLVDAAMPDHQHGMNRVATIAPTAASGFRADGLLFHMSGRWEIYFDVTFGAVTERAQVEIQIE